MPAFTRLGHERQDLLSPCDAMHVYTDQTSVYTLIRKSFEGLESEPMLTPRGKSPLPEIFSPEEDRTHDAASSRTASPTHFQRANPAPVDMTDLGRLTAPVVLSWVRLRWKVNSRSSCAAIRARMHHKVVRHYFQSCQ